MLCVELLCLFVVLITDDNNMKLTLQRWPYVVLIMESANDIKNRICIFIEYKGMVGFINR